MSVHKILLSISVLIFSLQFSKGQMNDPIPVEGVFQYQDCGCDVNVNLVIHNGINNNGAPGLYGGHEVSFNEEDTKGAFTVANLNDTDGDNYPDNIDLNGVLQNQNGDYERDLMKLKIEVIGQFPSTCSQVVQLTYSGYLRFYADFAKSIEINDLSFNLSELPKTIYIEAYEASNELLDISITAFLGPTIHDKVYATAIWFNSKEKYVDGIIPDPLALGFTNTEFDDIIVSQEDFGGEYYGQGFYNAYEDQTLFYGGRILMKNFNLKPIMNSQLPIYFDVTRRLNETSLAISSGTGNFIPNPDDTPFIVFPDNIEKPNDDINKDDEASIFPDFYSYDSPSQTVGPNYAPSAPNTASFEYWEGEFEEFMRASFSPFPFFGAQEEVIGSRVSRITFWNHARFLKLTSSSNDPYDITNQFYTPVINYIDSSVPSRLSGSGTGNITVEFSLFPITKGYTLAFLSDNRCALASNDFIIDLKEADSNTWKLTDPGKITVTIINNNQDPFTENTILYFTVINEPLKFSKIGVN